MLNSIESILIYHMCNGGHKLMHTIVYSVLYIYILIVKTLYGNGRYYNVHFTMYLITL